MKQITVRIEDDQEKSLKQMSEYAKIPVGWFIRYGIDKVINEFLEERRILNEHDEHFQRNRQSSFQENSSKHEKM